MKVLTLTTQFANNMGALLQCYALSRFLNSLDDVECEVINYLPKDAHQSWKIFRMPKSIKDFIMISYNLIRFDYVLLKRKRNKKVQDFIDRYLPLTIETYTKALIRQTPPIADAYICGSDQIWNPKLFDDTTYYFDFVKNKKKIAYAASSTLIWDDAFAGKVRPLLSEFSAISLREDINLKQVEQLSGKHVSVTIDPVFLLSAREWESLIYPVDIKEPYLLCYFIGVGPREAKIVKKLSEITGYKVVFLNVNQVSFVHADIEIRDLSPQEFVSYIKCASLVCTNSFHCAAFSMIFERNLKVIKKNTGLSRIDMLLQYYNLKDIYIDRESDVNIEKENLQTNYPRNRIAESVIEESKRFLVSSIVS